jgi:hypothetical protein
MVSLVVYAVGVLGRGVAQVVSRGREVEFDDDGAAVQATERVAAALEREAVLAERLAQHAPPPARMLNF